MMVSRHRARAKPHGAGKAVGRLKKDGGCSDERLPMASLAVVTGPSARPPTALREGYTHSRARRKRRRRPAQAYINKRPSSRLPTNVREIVSEETSIELAGRSGDAYHSVRLGLKQDGSI